MTQARKRKKRVVTATPGKDYLEALHTGKGKSKTKTKRSPKGLERQLEEESIRATIEGMEGTAQFPKGVSKDVARQMQKLSDPDYEKKKKKKERKVKVSEPAVSGVSGLFKPTITKGTPPVTRRPFKEDLSGSRRRELDSEAHTIAGRKTRWVDARGKPKKKYIDDLSKEIREDVRTKILPETLDTEVARVKARGIGRLDEMAQAAQLYQDQMKALRYMASSGVVKPSRIPEHGFTPWALMKGYVKRYKGNRHVKITVDKKQSKIYLIVRANLRYKYNDDIKTAEGMREMFGRILSLMHYVPTSEMKDTRRPKVSRGWMETQLEVFAEKVEKSMLRKE